MTHAIGLECVRCRRAYPLSPHDSDCPACRGTAPSALRVAYHPAMLRPRPFAPTGRGLWRTGDLLPVAADEAVSLGEGDTPLLAAPRLAAAFGRETLFIKDESRNPTGSFKDRLACVGIAAARRFNAPMIVSSSSGNAGAAAAAYAARAGLPCTVFTFREASPTLIAQMRALGAQVAFAAHKDDRLTLVREVVRRLGWFSLSPSTLPVTGSNPFAVEGCKTIAYEIAEALDWAVPDWVILPVCYGDALAGLQRGFDDLRALGWTDAIPRLVAAETAGSLAAALATNADQPPAMHPNQPSIATSIAAGAGTYQALAALRATNGRAVKIDDPAILHWQQRVATTEGIWLEPAAAAGFAALDSLTADDVIGRHDTVVVLATAGGLKDPMPFARPVPTVPADLDTALAILRAHPTDGG